MSEQAESATKAKPPAPIYDAPDPVDAARAEQNARHEREVLDLHRAAMRASAAAPRPIERGLLQPLVRQSELSLWAVTVPTMRLDQVLDERAWALMTIDLLRVGDRVAVHCLDAHAELVVLEVLGPPNRGAVMGVGWTVPSGKIGAGAMKRRIG